MKSKKAWTAMGVLTLFLAAISGLVKIYDDHARAAEKIAVSSPQSMKTDFKAVEAIKETIKKSQVLEFLTIGENPIRYKDEPVLAETLAGVYEPAKEGGLAAQKVAKEVDQMCQLGHYYGSQSRLNSIEFDPPAFPTEDTATVKARESWYLPYFDAKGPLPRNATLNTAVTYTLQFEHGHWLLVDDTTPYIQQ